VVTILLIVANVIAFLQTPGLGSTERSQFYFFEHAPIPCQLSDTCPGGLVGRGFGSFVIAIIVSTFLHAGFLHIAGNMLFLWVFGNNVEDFLGPIKYLIFYLAAGIAAAFAHVGWVLMTSADVCSAQDFAACVPAVGASGAVAAVMGAYLILFPRARVNVLVPIIIIFTMIQMSAFAVLGLWFLYQFLIAAQEANGVTGVAWMAHVGGFVFGAIAILILGGRPHGPPEPAWNRWRSEI
jgi:membrane associated rhomboid family serine protease